MILTSNYILTVSPVFPYHHSKVYKSAKNELILELHQQRKNINNALSAFNKIGNIVLDDAVKNEQIRDYIFKKISKEELSKHISDNEEIISGKYSSVFNLVTKRFNYLRQFSPALLEYIEFESCQARFKKGPLNILDGQISRN
jgi:hypothetical protein